MSILKKIYLYIILLLAGTFMCSCIEAQTDKDSEDEFDEDSFMAVPDGIIDTVQVESVPADSIKKEEVKTESSEKSNNTLNFDKIYSNLPPEYEEGYEEGYEDGMDDADTKSGYEYNFDDTDIGYTGKKLKDYKEGYLDGYQDGYDDNSQGNY